MTTPNSNYGLHRSPSLQTTRQVGLQTKLLSIVIPTIIGTLALSSLIGYGLIHKNAQEEVEQQLEHKAIIAKDTIEQLLDKALINTQLIVNNPQIINFLRTSNQQVKNSGLEQLSIPQLEQKFADTKLLTLNSALNHYLQQVAKTTGLQEISLTNSQGFNIAYSRPTEDFVQRDEDWWQKGKSQSPWLSNSKFDESGNLIGFELVQAIQDPNSGEFLGVIKASLPESYFDTVSESLLNTGIKNSQIVQIIPPNQERAIKTVTPQGLSPKQEIVGGIELNQIVSLILRQQNNQPELNEELKKRLCY